MFKKILLAFPIIAVVQSQVLAGAVEHIKQSQAQGLGTETVSVSTYRGYGDTIVDFRDLGETIRQINIGDGSRLVVNSDDPNCISHAAARSDRTCQAQILYLKQIKPIVIDELYTSGWTELKATTDENIYIFRIIYSSSAPGKTIYKLQPDMTEDPLATKDSLLDRYVVLRRGYREGLKKNYINEELASRIDSFLQKVYKGTSVSEAAKEAGISEQAVEKLELLGQLSDETLSGGEV